jgi:HD-GYP domain-containing protein (c-di-GMP phosphodiesterase class II)
MNWERIPEVQNFIRVLVAAVSSASLYSIDHTQVAKLCGEAHSRLREALGGEDDILLLLIDHELVYNGTPLDESMYTNKLVRILVSRGAGHLRIQRDVAPGELRALVAELSGRGTTEDAAFSTDNIRLGLVEMQAHEYGGREEVSGGYREGPALEEIPPREMETLLDIYECVRKHKRFTMSGISGIVSALINAFRRTSAPLLAIAPLRAMDEYTFTHSTNVSILNLAQAMAMGVDGPLLHDIGIAGMLHDVGKLFIPEEILVKTGKLTEAEWSIIKQHPVKGAHYLLNIPGVPRLAAVCAFEHHLKHDLSGYPHVRQDWRQSLCSQMTAISDLFDALRTRRPYRRPLEYDMIAVIMVENSGTGLHPVLTRNFLRVLAATAAAPHGETIVPPALTEN